MADAIVSYAVQRIGDFLIHEIAALQGVREDVEWLRDELRFMQSFLRDAELENQVGYHWVRQWVSAVTIVSYDTVDILENFNIKVEESGAPKHLFADYVRLCACICGKEVDLYNISKDIKSLKKRVRDISRRRESYCITDTTHGLLSEGHLKETRQTSYKTSYKDEMCVIGFEDVTKTLLAELELKTEPSRFVVSIYGMGGLGKTTLAKKLYHSVSSNFECRAWVSLSQKYKTPEVLQEIISSFKGGLTNEELDMVKKFGERDLARYLRAFLTGRRYLVVIDDVWHKEDWRILKTAFPDDKNGSRVMITTRKKSVAMQADERSFVHELRFLTAEESWNLFLQNDFLTGIEVPAMQVLAREMVEKCGGLPLAIIDLGKFLSWKDWGEIHEYKENILAELDEKDIYVPLTLSYNELSPEVKQCFLYTGMFPEGYEFDVDKLTQFWIAEGFIPQKEGIMEDVARQFLNELIDRSLIQVTGKFWERIVKCRVHNVLRVLAIKVALEVNFSYILVPQYHDSDFTLHRRLAVQYQYSQNNVSLGKFNVKLRTLLFFKQLHENVVGIEQLACRCSELNLLRVLDLNGINFDKNGQMVSNMIGKLILLKFLGLTNTSIRDIPSSIGNLKRLQTLEARSEYNCKLPRQMFKLKQLRHLDGLFEGPLYIESLTNVQTLRTVQFSQLSIINSINLRNLRELTLQNTSSLDFITNLQSLGTLILISSDTNLLPPLQPLSLCVRLLKLWLDGPLEKIPTLDDFPPSLARLILSKSNFTDDPMPTLERLPYLKSLELINSYKGKKISCSANGFGQLEVLRLSELYELEEWEVEEGAMPMVRGLGIYDCNRLKMVPEMLTFVPVVEKSKTDFYVHNYHG